MVSQENADTDHVIPASNSSSLHIGSVLHTQAPFPWNDLCILHIVATV